MYNQNYTHTIHRIFFSFNFIYISSILPDKSNKNLNNFEYAKKRKWEVLLITKDKFKFNFSFSCWFLIYMFWFFDNVIVMWYTNLKPNTELLGRSFTHFVNFSFPALLTFSKCIQANKSLWHFGAKFEFVDI